MILRLFVAALTVLALKPLTAAADEYPMAGVHMNVARHYAAKSDYLAAINRLRAVLSQFPASEHAPEGLARIADAYLTLRLDSEAQTAAAVLGRKFPGSHWSAHAHAALRSAALAPIENEQSWISRAFR